MSLPVISRPAAIDDTTAIRDYLNGQSDGAGDRFLEWLEETAERIGTMPEMPAVLDLDVRSTTVGRSRYVLDHRVHADRCEIMAVLHGSRDSSARRTRV